MRSEFISSFKKRFKTSLGLDLRSLALFRVGMAGVLLVDLVCRLGDLSAFYTDSGVLPRDYILDSFFMPGAWSLHLISGEASVQGLFFFAQLVAGLFLLVGYRTGWATFVSWVLLLSLHNRAPVILTGGDDVLRHLLFWSLFLPLGRYFSVDSALNTASTQLTGLSQKFTSGGTVAFILQVMVLYIFSALLKTGAEWHGEGSAVYYALHIDAITTSLAPYFLIFSERFPALTQSIYYIELFMPFLLISPWKNACFRWGAILLLALLNLGFGMAFHLGLFPWINLMALLAFIPSDFWSFVWKKISFNHKAFTLYYDGDCRVCQKGVYLLQTFLILPQAVLKPAQDNPVRLRQMQEHHSWVVDAENNFGKTYLKASAFLFCLSQSPWFFFLKPFLERTNQNLLPLANTLYDWVAGNRPLFFLLTKWVVWRPVSWARFDGKSRRSIVFSLMAILLAGYMVFLNGLSLNLNSEEYSESNTWALHPKIQWATTALGLGQSWALFAPYPMKESGEQGVLVLKDGQVLDEIKRVYQNERWEKLMIFMTFPQAKLGLIRQYADYFCDKQYKRNKNLKTKKEFDSLRFYFTRHATPPPNKSIRPFERSFLWEQSCTQSESF